MKGSNKTYMEPIISKIIVYVNVCYSCYVYPFNCDGKEMFYLLQLVYCISFGKTVYRAIDSIHSSRIFAFWLFQLQSFTQVKTNQLLKYLVINKVVKKEISSF